MIRVLSCVFVLILSSAAPLAGQFSASAPDPYAMPDLGVSGFRDINAKTLASQSLNLGIRNGIIITVGQSNWSNVVPTPYTPANPTKIDNLNPYDGALYRAADPLLGSQLTTANAALRLADKLVTANKFDRVILVPIEVGGTTVAQWETSLYPRLLATIARLSYRGMTPTAILWGQGESDHGTGQSAYTNSLTSVINRTRTAGYNGPWFVAKQTWNSGTVDANVQAAQLAIVNHGAGIWAGPDADSLNATNRQGDNTHWNDTGSDAYAGLWQTALGLFGPPF